MDITGIITIISMVMAVSNGIGMVLMYLRYIEITRNAIMTIRATEEELVEITDLLPVSQAGKE